MGLFTALGFLTVIPHPFRSRHVGTVDVGRSLGYFPAVGLVIGLLLAGVYSLSNLLFPTAVTSAIVLVALVLITGGLHLDGFADTCDGTASHRTAEERLRIMRDSRVGAFGVIGVFLLLLVKYVSLASLSGSLAVITLVLMPIVSRWVMVYAVVAYPYARASGLGQAFKEYATWGRFVVATVIAGAATLGLTRWAGFTSFYLLAPAIMLAAWIIAVGMGNYLKGKLSGLTGDTYGAINEVSEALVLVIFSFLAKNYLPGLSG